MLRVADLSYRYGGGSPVLDNVDLAVDVGEMVVVLGGNGSGKTTLLRCIARTLTPAAGRVSLDGVDLTGLGGDSLRRARHGLALISQYAALVKRRSVLANVACGALGYHETWFTALGGLPRSELQSALCHLDAVGLRHLAQQRAGTLSGGQAQRVAIARALAQRPRAILADEPVASLDPEAAEEIMGLLKRLAKAEGLAVLCVLHQVDVAFRHADRVVGIRGGRIAFDAPCHNVPREQVKSLYMREAA